MLNIRQKPDPEVGVRLVFGGIVVSLTLVWCYFVPHIVADIAQVTISFQPALKSIESYLIWGLMLLSAVYPFLAVYRAISHAFGGGLVDWHNDHFTIRCLWGLAYRGHALGFSYAVLAVVAYQLAIPHLRGFFPDINGITWIMSLIALVVFAYVKGHNSDRISQENLHFQYVESRTFLGPLTKGFEHRRKLWKHELALLWDSLWSGVGL